MSDERIAAAAGAVALALVLGALAFQYFGHFAPCEMCHWQRWPLIAAAIAGIGGGGFLATRRGTNDWALPLAICTLFLAALSGLIGAYQAGVEWGYLPGPAACTGGPIHVTGSLGDLDNPVVRCDIAAWRLFGISLAGYNAIVSLVTASFGAAMLYRGHRS